MFASCISFYSYIKPQLNIRAGLVLKRCISFYSYIKPQQCPLNLCNDSVVYRSIPTSNRNFRACAPWAVPVVYRSIPTSNRNSMYVDRFNTKRCISFYSYIKPQLTWHRRNANCVVYRSIPTSNRNLHEKGIIKEQLYIVLFLHQTATWNSSEVWSVSCISFYSYIKPQLVTRPRYREVVVYRSIPTSNRNLVIDELTSFKVVYRSIPTSNRNLSTWLSSPLLLYIVLFLHQTATFLLSESASDSCISFYSYIKPQLPHAPRT